jgi:hypothetical protein
LEVALRRVSVGDHLLKRHSGAACGEASERERSAENLEKSSSFERLFELFPDRSRVRELAKQSLPKFGGALELFLASPKG